MATRLKTRLSAGAALVTGLGMIGLATAVPAQAAATMQYSCTTPLGPQVLEVTLDTDAPATTTTGEVLTITPSGTVTLNSSIANGMAGALGWEDVAADIPDVVATISDGTTTADITTDLSIPRTQFFDGTQTGDDRWTAPGGIEAELAVNGTTQTTTIGQAGTYTVSAPATFGVTFNGYNAAGETGTLSPIASTCTYVVGSGSQVIDTVTVTDAPEPTDPTTSEPTTSEPTTSEPTTSEPTTSEPTTSEPTTSEPTTSEPTTSEPTTSEPTTSEPTTSEPTTSEPTTSEPTTSEPTTTGPTTSEPTVEANDWFNEPSSLPITDDEKHFTIEGMATQAGTIDVVLLDGDKNVLRTIAWDVTEGSNSKDFPFAEGTDYVRIVSQDCVDADGNDGSVAGGCNVEYYAPWVSPDSDSSTSDGDDDGTTAPETPGVVQTDGFTRVQEPAGNNAAAFLLGGTLLAGAGAGSILMARRRQGAQH